MRVALTWLRAVLHGRTFGVWAHITIPAEGTPPSLAVLRLQTAIKRLPSISSLEYHARSPDTICRGLSSPTSISSHHSFSESGCSHTFTILPTRRSSLVKRGCGPAGAFPFFFGAGAGAFGFLPGAPGPTTTPR